MSQKFYLPQRNENIRPYENLYMNVHRLALNPLSHTIQGSMNVQLSIIHNNKKWKQLKYLSVDEWINQMVQPYNGPLSSHKKKWSTDCYKIDEAQTHSAISQTQIFTYCMTIYMKKSKFSKSIETEAD